MSRFVPQSWILLIPRIAILAEGAFEWHRGKTGIGVIRYGKDTVVAFIASTKAGMDVSQALHASLNTWRGDPHPFTVKEEAPTCISTLGHDKKKKEGEDHSREESCHEAETRLSPALPPHLRARAVARFTLLKQQPETIWLDEVFRMPLKQSLRHLNRAFVHFFQRRAASPEFKRKGRPQAASLHSDREQRHGRAQCCLDPARRRSAPS